MIGTHLIPLSWGQLNGEYDEIRLRWIMKAPRIVASELKRPLNSQDGFINENRILQILMLHPG